MRKLYASLIVILLLTALPFAGLAQLTVSKDSANSNCFSNNGWATVTASGATGTVSYLWSTGASTQTISGLAAGTYTVTVYDSAVLSGVVDTVYFEDFDGTVAWTLDILTPGHTDGVDHNFWTIDDDEGGFAPPTCGNAGGGDSTLHITSVFCPSCGASYDAGGLCGILFCPEANRLSYSPNFSTVGRFGLRSDFNAIGNGDNLVDNALMVYSLNSWLTWDTIIPSIKSTICGGGQGRWTAFNANLPSACNNQATVSIGYIWVNNDDGVGTDPSVAINNVRISDTLNGVTVDSVVTTFDIVELGAPAIDISGIVITQPDCGLANGSITGITVSGGVPDLITGYTITWDSSGVTVDNDINLNAVFAGTYHLHIVDDSGCTYDTSFTLTATGIPVVNAFASDTIVCLGDAVDLWATISLGGGSYVWSGPGIPFPVPNDSVTVIPPSSSTYFFDWFSGACNVQDSIDITVVSPTSIYGTDTIICPGTAVTISAVGPAIGVTYTWSGGDLPVPVVGTSVTVAPLTTQIYNLHWDLGTCFGDTAVTVTTNSSFTVSALAAPSVICAGSPVTLSAVGPGFGVYTWYKYALPFPTFVDSGTPSVQYPTDTTLYILQWNSGGCFAADSVVVVVINLDLIAPIVTDPSCGLSNGSVTFSVSGGSGSYNNVAYDTLGNFIGNPVALGAGTYVIFAIDNVNGCHSDSITVTLTDIISPVTLADTIITNPLCFGDQSGSIQLIPTGGVDPIVYSWSHSASETDSFANNLNAGSYTVTLDDASPCPTFTATITVGGPSAPVTANAVVLPDTCSQNKGSICVTGVGGTPGYTYSWSTGAGGNCITSLTSGPYSVTVTDNNGCDTTYTYNVGSAGTPQVVLNPIDTICFGDSTGSASITTFGAGPFFFVWSADITNTSSSISGLKAGSYSVTVTGANGCDTVLNFSIDEFIAGTLQIFNDTSIHMGQTAHLVAVSSTKVGNQIWTPDFDIVNLGMEAYASPNATTVYYLEATTEDGCILRDSVIVVVDTLLPVLTIPNVFTPNDDNINDNFYVTANEAIVTYEIHMYDRWGNQVWESFDYSAQWDGRHYETFEDCDMGVYSYFVVIKTLLTGDVPAIKKGNVTLIR